MDRVWQPVEYAREVGEDRHVDYAWDDTSVGIELLSVSECVDIGDFANQPAVEKVARKLELKMLA